MRIHVLIKEFTNEQMDKILDHYNANKDPGEYNLERLDRSEGGFQINLPPNQWKINYYTGYADANDQIRQVRWSNGYLLSMGYRGFTEKQYLLLYESIIVGFGGENVILEP